MFIGHFGTAFASKKIDNRISLGTTFIAAQFLDILWPLFVLLGIEKVAIERGNTAVTPLNFIYYPFSHSMISALFWAISLGIIYYMFKKNIRGSMLIGALVFGHWILDLISHRADLQIAPGISYKIGLGLWYSIPATIIVEGSIFVIGVFLYWSQYNNKSIAKRIGLWTLVIIMAVIYIANMFSPPPPSVDVIAYSDFGMALFIGWAYWIDYKH